MFTHDIASVDLHHICDFGENPKIVLETGHPIAPRSEIWQCLKCKHGVTRPAMEDVSPLYANRASEDYLLRDGQVVQALKMFVFRRLARSLLQCASGPVHKIADYGTGCGMLAKAFAHEVAPSTKVYAFDFFDDPPSDMQTVEYQSFADSKRLRGQVDLLTCFHVLEHSDDPDTILNDLQSYVRPGGTLVIEVPNVDCVWTPWFGKYCANWYVPYHRVHFSRESLRRLVIRHGLKVLAEHDVCGPTFSPSLASLFGIKPNGALLLLALTMRPFQWVAERLSGRASALRILARKSMPPEY